MASKPNGTFTMPAKTCKDLKVDYPNLTTGNYWIDPNGGCRDDAVYVKCIFDERKTCLTPRTPIVLQSYEMGQFKKSELYKYKLRELLSRRESDIDVNLNGYCKDSQINFLQLESMYARQEVIVDCKDANVMANNNKAVFYGYDEGDLSPTVISNTCERSGSGKIALVFDESAKSLPMMDVQLPYQRRIKFWKMGITLDELCFTW